MCWADNAVGQQKEPCVFHIIAAGKPNSPTNCTLMNQTSDGLEIDCNEGKLNNETKRTFKFNILHVPSIMIQVNGFMSTAHLSIFISNFKCLSIF